MKRKGKGLIFMGLLLIAAALFLTGYNLYDQMRAQRAAAQAAAQLAERLPETVPHRVTDFPDYLLTPEMEMPVETIDGVDYVGVLRIPSLALELPVISQWSYPNLKTAPCRYSGSAYLNNLIICGHNYTSHFGNLKSLHIDDAVTFTDMDGNLFTYQVAELETLSPQAIEEMESGDWDLTLFTCTIGGQSRVAVRCILVESASQSAS